MKSIFWTISFGVVIGLLAGGIIFLVSRPSRGQPTELLPPPTQQPIKVHVSGEVQEPGVYTLPSGSRVGDAIQAAAGFAENANQSGLNLAAFIHDGDKIEIPSKQASIENTSSDRISVIPLQNLIDINTASQSELETLPRIGPTLAQAILTFRQENGPFKTIEDIQDVPGIGSATFSEIKSFITVGELP